MVAPGARSNLDDELPSKQLPLPEPSLKKSNRFLSVPSAAHLVVDEAVVLVHRVMPGLNGSEKLAVPHMKLPKILFSLTTQPSEP